MPIKEFILWLEKRNSVHVTYTKNLRIDVGHTSLEKFIYFILLIKYSQGGEMFSFCFFKIEVLHQADQTSVMSDSEQF